MSNEKTRVSKEQIKEQMTSIKNATETIKEALGQMVDCGARKSLLITLDALEKKVEKYSGESKQRVKMTDEEKEVLRKFREGKIIITEKTDETEVSEVPADDNTSGDDERVEFNESKKKGKKGKNN